jgi:hypothetical protein
MTRTGSPATTDTVLCVSENREREAEGSTGQWLATLAFRLIGTLRAPLAAASHLPQEQFGVQATAQKDRAQVASRDARQNTSRL